MSNQLLSADEIRAHRLPTERLTCEWMDPPRDVIVQALPGYFVEWIQRQTKDSPEFKAEAHVFVKALVDENGKRMFSDGDVDTVAERFDPALIEAVVAKAYFLSALSEETIAAVKKSLRIPAAEPSGE